MFATLERPKLLFADKADPLRPTHLLNGASPVWQSAGHVRTRPLIVLSEAVFSRTVSQTLRTHARWIRSSSGTILKLCVCRVGATACGDALLRSLCRLLANNRARNRLTTAGRRARARRTRATAAVESASRARSPARRVTGQPTWTGRIRCCGPLRAAAHERRLSICHPLVAAPTPTLAPPPAPCAGSGGARSWPPPQKTAQRIQACGVATKFAASFFSGHSRDAALALAPGEALPSNGCPPPQQLAHMLGPRRQLQIAVGLLLLTSPTTRAPRARRKQQPSTASTMVPPRQSSRSGAAASNPFVPLRDITEPELLSLLRIPDTADQVGYVDQPLFEQLHAGWAPWHGAGGGG